MATKKTVEPRYIELKGDHKIFRYNDNSKYKICHQKLINNSAHYRELPEIVTSSSLLIASSKHGKYKAQRDKHRNLFSIKKVWASLAFSSASRSSLTVFKTRRSGAVHNAATAVNYAWVLTQAQLRYKVGNVVRVASRVLFFEHQRAPHYCDLPQPEHHQHLQTQVLLCNQGWHMLTGLEIHSWGTIHYGLLCPNTSPLEPQPTHFAEPAAGTRTRHSPEQPGCAAFVMRQLCCKSIRVWCWACWYILWRTVKPSLEDAYTRRE